MEEPTAKREAAPAKEPPAREREGAAPRKQEPAAGEREGEPLAGKDPGSDPIYKRLYAFPEMVADLLRSVLPADALEALDMDTLAKVSASYVGDDYRQRHGDTVWRVERAGRWTYVLVLLEFQSSSDATMALRVLEYTAMLYRESLRAGEASPGRLPPVLPIVLYNGESPWSAAQDVGELIEESGPALLAYQPSQRYAMVDERHASADYAGERTRAVALLEQSRSPADLASVAGVLVGILGGPDADELRRAFADWLWVLFRRMHSPEESPVPPPELTLEDVRMTLEERVARWPEQWRQQGIEEGMERGIEQGMERGVEEGIAQGLAQQRERLRRQAEARFGARTAERLSASLRREDDPQRLDAIAVAVVRCETGEELIRHARQPSS